MYLRGLLCLTCLCCYRVPCDMGFFPGGVHPLARWTLYSWRQKKNSMLHSNLHDLPDASWYCSLYVPAIYGLVFDCTSSSTLSIDANEFAPELYLIRWIHHNRGISRALSKCLQYQEQTLELQAAVNSMGSIINRLNWNLVGLIFSRPGVIRLDMHTTFRKDRNSCGD